MHSHRRHRSRLRRIGHILEYAGVRLLLGVFAILPWAAINWLASAASWVHATFLPIRRRIILHNLKLALPGLSSAERKRISRGVVYHSVLLIAELAKLHNATPECIRSNLLADPNTEASLKKLAERRSFLLATGHFGNWEWLGPWLVQRGFPLTVVYKPMHNPFVDEYVLGIRKDWGEEAISTRAQGPRALVTALRKRGIVAILADQDARHGGEFIPFFGQPASTAIGLGALAVRLNLPILIGFVIRESPGHFRYQTQAILEPDPAAEPATEIRRLMFIYHQALETVIRQYPEQYFWWHKRWKTQPKKVEVSK